MSPNSDVDLLSRAAFVAGALIVGGAIGGVFAWLRRTPGPSSTIAAGCLGAIAGIVIGFGFAAYRFTRISAEIGAVSVGVGELAVTLGLIGILGAGLVVHLLFAHLQYLSGAQRLAPVVAGAVSCAAVTFWFQSSGPGQ